MPSRVDATADDALVERTDNSGESGQPELPQTPGILPRYGYVVPDDGVEAPEAEPEDEVR